jgi:hypothetical protein
MIGAVRLPAYLRERRRRKLERLYERKRLARDRYQDPRADVDARLNAQTRTWFDGGIG